MVFKQTLIQGVIYFRNTVSLCPSYCVYTGASCPLSSFNHAYKLCTAFAIFSAFLFTVNSVVVITICTD